MSDEEKARHRAIQAIMRGEAVIYGPVTILGAVITTPGPLHFEGRVVILSCNTESSETVLNGDVIHK